MLVGAPFHGTEATSRRRWSAHFYSRPPRSRTLRGTHESETAPPSRRCGMILLNIAARCLPEAHPPPRIPQRLRLRLPLRDRPHARPARSEATRPRTAIPKRTRCVRRATPACSASQPACSCTFSRARNACYDRNRIFATDNTVVLTHCCWRRARAISSPLAILARPRAALGANRPFCIRWCGQSC